MDQLFRFLRHVGIDRDAEVAIGEPQQCRGNLIKGLDLLRFRLEAAFLQTKGQLLALRERETPQQAGRP